MLENKLLKDVNNAIDKEVLRGVTDITQKIKEDGRETFTKIEDFWKGVDEDFDISDLEVYLEKPFLPRKGLLGNMLAGNVGNRVILSTRLARESANIRTFIITHEIVHFLTQGEDVEVNSKVHKRAGYALGHIGYGNSKDEIITKKEFFKYFNDGMDDWLTILILGEKYKEFLKKDKGHGRLYELAKFLVVSVEDLLTQKEVIKDYINKEAKFMQAIHRKYGKHSITILNQISAINLEDTLEFFKTDDEARRDELRSELLENH